MPGVLHHANDRHPRHAAVIAGCTNLFSNGVIACKKSPRQFLVDQRYRRCSFHVSVLPARRAARVDPVRALRLGLRWAMRAIGLPLIYALLVYISTRPPEPLYQLAGKTVLTVTGQGGPPILRDGKPPTEPQP